jgi:hypothetical protein
MRKSILHKFLLLTLIGITTLQSCKDDSYVLTPEPVINQSFTEEFDTAAAALARGWKFINNSYPAGSGVWQNGGALISPLFNAYSQHGTYPGFIGTDYTSTSAATGVISNWLISPEIMMNNGDKIIFYSRSQLSLGTVAGDSTDWGNRLQVRLNKHGTDLLVGNVQAYYEWLFTPSPNFANDDPGSFDISLLDVNPNQYEWHKVVPGAGFFTNYDAITNILAFPVKWTRFEVTVSGLDKTTRCRFGIRYFITGGGNNGLATGVGIDKLEYKTVGY